MKIGPRKCPAASRSGLQGLTGGAATRLRRLTPHWANQAVNRVYWLWYDARDFLAEAVDWRLSHGLYVVCYRHLLATIIGRRSNVHRGWRLYCPPRVPTA